jgi:hypothetical protein
VILTADTLLESIKRGITVPSNQEQLEDTDFLAFANEELVSVILPMLTAIRQEYLIAKKPVDLVDGTPNYRIPYRALGRTIRDIIFVDSSGNRNPLPQIPPEEAHVYQRTSTDTGTPRAFYLENDHIILVPTPNNSDEDLIVSYPIRPSALVKLADVGVVDTYSLVAGTITIDTAVIDFTTSTPLDIVSYRSGNIIKATDITPTNVSSTTLTFTASDLPSDLEADDYICLAQESPVVPIPEEACVVLARAVQNRVLESIGDFEGLQAGQQLLKMRLDDLRSLLTPRVEGRPQVIIGAANKFFVGGRKMFPRIRI